MPLAADKPSDPKGLTLEAWAQGYMAGSLIIMAAVTIANMRKHVLLHKLILIEVSRLCCYHTNDHKLILFTAHIWHVPRIFHLSRSAVLWMVSLRRCDTSKHIRKHMSYISDPASSSLTLSQWVLHNIIAWMKNKPFFNRTTSLIYITTVCLSIPYWITEITANFIYFNPPYNTLFTRTRPFEALCRDPWWIFTVISLFWNIKSKYDFSLIELCRVSPRFGILLGAMVLSVAFIICDILSVTQVITGSGLPDGINPFWKLAFVFKCLTDTVVLDDFKTALDRLKQYRLQKMGSVLPVTHHASSNKSSRALELSRTFSPSTWRAKKSVAPYRDSDDTFKPAVGGNWEAEIDRLDFCTVPDTAYLGNKTSVTSRES